VAVTKKGELPGRKHWECPLTLTAVPGGTLINNVKRLQDRRIPSTSPILTI